MRRGFWTTAVIAALLAIGLLGSGCKPDQPIIPETMLPDPVITDEPIPTYTELIQRYNATTSRLSPIWAEARVDLVWRNEKGKAKNEHGDGRFMFVKPSRVVLEVQEFGKGFWAGADGERYWFFDLQERTAYVGRFENLHESQAVVLPIPISPADLLYILGLAPIDAALIPQEPAVERVAGHYLVEPPGLGLRMLLDPTTTRPVRVDLLDEQGNSAVICRLTEPIPVKHGDPDDLPGPHIASVVDVVVPGREARMTLTLKRPTHDDKNIRDQHFDFEILMQALKIKPKDVVDLDVPAP